MKTFLLGKREILKKETGKVYYFITVGQTTPDSVVLPAGCSTFGIVKTADVFVTQQIYDKVTPSDFMGECVLEYNVSIDGKAYLKDISVLPFSDV